MGSIEMAALNVVHAAANIGSFGMVMALASKRPAMSCEFEGGEEPGYEAYKKKLISEGKYRQHR